MADSTPQNTGKLAPPWKPGQSGNPGGRPSTAALRAALKPHERQAIETLVACLECESDTVRLAAAREILDRLYGKVEATKDAPSWLSDDQILEVLS